MGAPTIAMVVRGVSLHMDLSVGWVPKCFENPKTIYRTVLP